MRAKPRIWCASDGAFRRWGRTSYFAAFCGHRSHGRACLGVCRTPMHCDVMNTYSWSASLAGRKRWLLFPPDQTGLLFDRHGRSRVPHCHCHRKRHAGIPAEIPAGIPNQKLTGNERNAGIPRRMAQWEDPRRTDPPSLARPFSQPECPTGVPVFHGSSQTGALTLACAGFTSLRRPPSEPPRRIHTMGASIKERFPSMR